MSQHTLIQASSAFVVLALLGGSAPLSAGAQGLEMSWHVVHAELNDRGQALLLGDSAQTFVLKDNWSCTVGSTLNRPSHQARTTTCRKGEQRFEFTVQCEPARSKDHTQIRFRDAQGKSTDFIDVSCELRSSRPQ